jgi:hypothetical protein
MKKLFKNFGFNVSGRYSILFMAIYYGRWYIDAATVIDAQINYELLN